MAGMKRDTQAVPPQVSALRTPARTERQRLEALAWANTVRRERSLLKARLKRGEEDIQGVLLSPPECIHTAKVVDLLRALPKVGPVRASQILEECRISSAKTVIGLTPRQRAELVTRLTRS